MTAEIDIPDPLTPVDCDLRDFPFMPLDVVRLRDSDIAAISSGDEFRCAVLLWCASWHQIPAGSLPDDDIVLSQFAGFGRVVKAWKKLRNGSLRGWVKCSDGRLYHPVVAEKAVEAWTSRVKFREEKEKERIRKAEARARIKAEAEAAEALKAAQLLDCENNVRDLSGGQNSGVPRTNSENPPEIALIGTVDRGQWTVDRGQLTTKDKSSDTSNSVGPAEPENRDDDKPQSRNVKISILLRSHGVKPMTAMHPLAISWAANTAITDALLADVIDQARQYKPTGDIHPNYLKPIIEEKLNPAPANAARDDNAWRKSDAGIDRKARELGMFANRNEDYKAFADRITIEIAKRKRAGGLPA